MSLIPIFLLVMQEVVVLNLYFCMATSS